MDGWRWRVNKQYSVLCRRFVDIALYWKLYCLMLQDPSIYEIQCPACSGFISSSTSEPGSCLPRWRRLMPVALPSLPQRSLVSPQVRVGMRKTWQVGSEVAGVGARLSRYRAPVTLEGTGEGSCHSLSADHSVQRSDVYLSALDCTPARGRSQNRKRGRGSILSFWPWAEDDSLIDLNQTEVLSTCLGCVDFSKTILVLIMIFKNVSVTVISHAMCSYGAWHVMRRFTLQDAMNHHVIFVSSFICIATNRNIHYIHTALLYNALFTYHISYTAGTGDRTTDLLVGGRPSWSPEPPYSCCAGLQLTVQVVPKKVASEREQTYKNWHCLGFYAVYDKTIRGYAYEIVTDHFWLLINILCYIMYVIIDR